MSYWKVDIRLAEATPVFYAFFGLYEPTLNDGNTAQIVGDSESTVSWADVFVHAATTLRTMDVQEAAQHPGLAIARVLRDRSVRLPQWLDTMVMDFDPEEYGREVAPFEQVVQLACSCDDGHGIKWVNIEQVEVASDAEQSAVYCFASAVAGAAAVRIDLCDARHIAEGVIKAAYGVRGAADAVADALATLLLGGVDDSFARCRIARAIAARFGEVAEGDAPFDAL